MVSASNIEKPDENADIDTEYWSNALGMRKLSQENKVKATKPTRTRSVMKKKKTLNPGNKDPVGLGYMGKERSDITKQA